MTKKYKLEFIFREDNPHGDRVIFEFDRFEEALSEAKFYFDIFFNAVWHKLNNKSATNLPLDVIFQETMKVASDFVLMPNNSNFNFDSYAKERHDFYCFKKSLNGLKLR